MSKRLIIDGSVLEGGGQILRMSVAMSGITGTPIEINKIRAGRKKPGLAAQHLNGIILAKQLSSALVEGANMGSTTVSFEPKRLNSAYFSADTKTAGSVALLFQVSLPLCLYGNGTTTLNLKGGTNADMAPQIEYVTRIFRPVFQKFGADFNFNIKKRGFFPVGKGEVEFQIPAVVGLNSINLTDFGKLQTVQGEVFYAGKIQEKEAHAMALSAKNLLKYRAKTDVDIRIVHFSPTEAFGNGWGINLVATTSTGCTLGASQIGRPGISGEQLGRLAAEELAGAIDSGACVDQHLQDQLIIFMALASGRSSIRTGPITLHTETAIHIISQFCEAKFDVQRVQGGTVVQCDGIGLRNELLSNV